MLTSVDIKVKDSQSLQAFLESQDFVIDNLSPSVCKITRHEELPVFIQKEGQSLFFEVDLGNVSAIANEEFYFKCLDLNTEILPVSIGIDRTNSEDPRLVLVESREVQNLDDNEILSVIDALELATDRVEALLQEYMN